jgi:predicted nucleic acid-binding protein
MTTPTALPQPVVIDVSIWVAFFLRTDVNLAVSYQWIVNHTTSGGRMYAPTILLAEVASAVARRTGKLRRGLNALNTLESLTLFDWVQMEHDLIREAAQTAATLGLRGADAIYVATAKRLSIPLLTWDAEQLAKPASIIPTMTP